MKNYYAPYIEALKRVLYKKIAYKSIEIYCRESISPYNTVLFATGTSVFFSINSCT